MASRATRRVHLHTGSLATVLCATAVSMAAAQSIDPVARAQRAVAQVVVHDGTGATVASGPGFFLDIGKLVAPRSLVGAGYAVGVLVGGKEQRATAVLAEDPQADVVLIAVDLPDGAPSAVRLAARATAAQEVGQVLSAEGAPAEITVDPARQVPGLGLVHAVRAGGPVASGSAVVNARGELIGTAISAGGEAGSPVTFVVPASRLLAMPRVGPLPMLDWSLRARSDASETERASHRGEAAALGGRLDDAAAAFEAAATADPSNADAWVALAACRRSQRQGDASIAVWRRAVAAQPTNALFHHELALDLSDAGHHDQAATEFGEVARLRPGDAEAQFNLGVALSQIGRYEDEYKAYRAALAINPSHVRALRNLGVTCLTLDRNEEAVTSFARAGSLAPADPEIQTGLGLSYLSIRRYREAIDVFRRTLQLAPSFVKAHFGLGAAYAASGDQAAARAECQALRAIDRQKGDRLCKIVDGK